MATAVFQAIKDNNKDALINYEQLPGSEFSAPTVEHYLPQIYTAALRDDNDSIICSNFFWMLIYDLLQ